MDSIQDEDDLFSAALKKLRVEHSNSLTEIAQLKARLYDAQCEISDLRSELKETRAILGETVVKQSKAISAPNAVAGPSKHVETMQKRARSVSIEIIEQPLSQNENKNAKQVSANIPVVSANSEKSRQRLYPTPASSCNQSNDAKRRRIEPADPEPQARSVTSQKSPTEASSSSLSSSSAHKLSVSVSPKKEIKPKHEGKVRVPESIMEAYLSSSQPLPISPAPLLDLQVPRKFLRLAYGGSDQHFLQFIRDTHNPSGRTKRRMVFPMLDMNPAMPCQPGHAGLVFASRHEILSDGPWTVFCKPPETGKALWLYLGEYNSVLCGKMTEKEFGIQRDAVKKEWAKLLLRMKQYDVYVSMRARIALRKAGVLPVDDINDAEILIKAEMDRVKVNKGTEVTEEDIMAAFSRGDEGIDIIRMTCVKYDHVFAEDMKVKFANYDKMLLANNQKKEPGGNDGEDEDEDDSSFTASRWRSRRKGKRKIHGDDSGDDSYQP